MAMTSRGLARLNSGTGSSSQVSHVGGRNSGTHTISYRFRGAVAGSWIKASPTALSLGVWVIHVAT